MQVIRMNKMIIKVKCLNVWTISLQQYRKECLENSDESMRVDLGA